METIKIAHLYYDLMNLYGESGNIMALKSSLERQGVKVKVDYLTKGKQLNFKEYDIFYMGQGSELNQEIVRKDILRYKNLMKKLCKNKTFIVTGNAYELFGNDIDGKEALGIFDFSTKTVRNRIVGEQIYKTYLLNDPVIGFQNRNAINDNKENNLFNVIKGDANNQNTTFEGIKLNSFYGTYTLGPLLIRNPHLTDLIIKNLFEKKGIKFKEFLDTPDYMAYHEYLKNFNIKTSNE